MKKILYIAPMMLLFAGCKLLMQPVVYQPPPPDNPPVVYEPSQPPPANDYNPAYVNYDNSPQTDQVFYDELAPFGRWIDYPDYGYVWVPNVGYDFRPYASNGYWAYSDYGWTWVSGYTWGWATFHYGRWFYDDNYGWMWLPGDEWAPAWVTWGQSGDYYCWAPLPPRVSMREASLGWWTPPVNAWNVVPVRHLNQLDVTVYVVNNVTVVNNVVHNVRFIDNVDRDMPVATRTRGSSPGQFNRGPRLNDVERYTGRRITAVRVSDYNRPGAQTVSNNQLLTYRPPIKRDMPQGDSKPAPRKIEPFRKGDDFIRQPRMNQGTDRDQNPQGNQPQQNRNPDNRFQNRQPAAQPQNQPPVANPAPGQNPGQRPNDQPQNPPRQNQPNNQPQPDRSHDDRFQNRQPATQPQNQPPAVNPNPGQDQQNQPQPNRGRDGQFQNRQPVPQPQNQQPTVSPNPVQNPGQRQPAQQPQPEPNQNNQQNKRPAINPRGRQSLQPVHGNKVQPNNNIKLDTTKRRNPNNQ